jgi:predicted Co/Zn/Cd cation transporter (cation efflux family)
MKTLAITLLVASPILLFIGAAGCVAAVSSIGNGGQEMSCVAALALVAAAPCFITGMILLFVDRRRRRRRKQLSGGEP